MTLTWWTGRAAVLGMAVLTMLGGVTGAVAQTVVKLAHAVSTQDPYQSGSERFKEFVEKGTGGRLQVQIFPAGQLGNEREIIEGVKLGTIEIGLVASAPLAGFSTAFLLFDLPFLFNDATHARRVLDGPVGDKVARTLEPIGIKVLAYNESGFRMMFNSKRAVRTPDDLKGLKFRVMENPVYVSAAFGIWGRARFPSRSARSTGRLRPAWWTAPRSRST